MGQPVTVAHSKTAPRGISKFYDGKSKSYGSLVDAAKVSSIQDIVKKEDAYSRKRKNMIAHTVLLEKLCNSSSENGVPKRLARCAESGETAKKSSLMVGGGRPPLYRNGRRAVNDGSLDSSRGVYRAPRKSLSLSDLMSGVTGLCLHMPFCHLYLEVRMRVSRIAVSAYAVLQMAERILTNGANC
ncbi:hypothetical protein Tco_1356005 [Tanacetum coccineum]